MTTLELTQHPELAGIAAELRKGLVVILTDHGSPLGEVQPTKLDRGAWLTDLAAFRASLRVTPGENAVLAMRAEDDH